MKEIQKARYQIYISTKKMIILRKIHMTIKSFVPPFCSHPSLRLNGKKRLIMRLMRKKHIYASAANLLYMRIGNLDWCKP